VNFADIYHVSEEALLVGCGFIAGYATIGLSVEHSQWEIKYGILAVYKK